MEEKQIVDADLVAGETTTEAEVGSATDVTQSDTVESTDATAQPVLTVTTASDLTAEVDTTGETTGGEADVGVEADVSGISESLNVFLTILASAGLVINLRVIGSILYPRVGRPPIKRPFFLTAAILSRVRSLIISRSNWAKESRMFKVSRPMDIEGSKFLLEIVGRGNARVNRASDLLRCFLWSIVFVHALKKA